MIKRIPAGKFKTHCLKIMDEVYHSHQKIIVTKHNIPVVQIVPIDPRSSSLFVWLRGTVHFNQDIIFQIDEEWDANR